MTASPATPPSRFSPEELRMIWADYNDEGPESQEGPAFNPSDWGHQVLLRALRRVVERDRERRKDALTGDGGTTSTRD